MYRKVFETIADQEAPYVNDELEFACFGDSESSYKDVVRPFYQFWEAFRTGLNFEWLQEHEHCKEYGRKGNRYIMRENQKIRDAARKERNEQIRVTFVYIFFSRSRARNFSDSGEIFLCVWKTTLFFVRA